MSARHTHQVWTRSRAQGSHRLVLVALANHADWNGEVAMPQRTIAQLCNLSKSRVEEIIRSLVDAGELRVLDAGAGRGKPARYWITPPKAVPNCPEVVKPGTAPAKTITKSQAKEPVADPVLSGTEATPRAVRVGLPVDGAPAATSERMDATAGRDPHQTPSPGLTLLDVKRVLDAAGIQPAPDQPFYWSRQEHKADLAEVLRKTGMTVDGLCAALRAAAKTPEGPVKRMTDLLDLIGRARSDG